MPYKLDFEQYQQGLEQGKFLGLKCFRCRTVTFPPMGVCRHCGGMDLEVTPLKGEGVIRTFTVIRVAPEGRKPPYAVAMVEMEDGPYVIGNLVGTNPDDADMQLIGRKVTLGSQITKGDLYAQDDRRVLTFTLV